MTILDLWPWLAFWGLVIALVVRFEPSFSAVLSVSLIAVLVSGVAVIGVTSMP